METMEAPSQFVFTGYAHYVHTTRTASQPLSRPCRIQALSLEGPFPGSSLVLPSPHAAPLGSSRLADSSCSLRLSAPVFPARPMTSTLDRPTLRSYRSTPSLQESTRNSTHTRSVRSPSHFQPCPRPFYSHTPAPPYPIYCTIQYHRPPASSTNHLR